MAVSSGINVPDATANRSSCVKDDRHIFRFEILQKAGQHKIVTIVCVVVLNKLVMCLVCFVQNKESCVELALLTQQLPIIGGGASQPTAHADCDPQRHL